MALASLAVTLAFFYVREGAAPDILIICSFVAVVVGAANPYTGKSSSACDGSERPLNVRTALLSVWTIAACSACTPGEPEPTYLYHSLLNSYGNETRFMVEDEHYYVFGKLTRRSDTYYLGDGAGLNYELDGLPDSMGACIDRLDLVEAQTITAVMALYHDGRLVDVIYVGRGGEGECETAPQDRHPG